jgi:membrane protein DedA with SNARE-associated domain
MSIAMDERGVVSDHDQRRQLWRTLAGPGERSGRLRKLRYYLFITSIVVAFLAALALLNAYLQFLDLPSYDMGQGGISSEILLAGYVGMFLIIMLSPVPDYFTVPAYGSLAALGVFDPFLTFLVCLAGAIVPVTYLPGRYAARPLLLKGVAYFGISEKALTTSERWLEEHGRFSIFIATFIPFFYSVAGMAAGMLKMSFGKFMLASAAGYGLRFVVLEFVGYSSIEVFTASFDYSQRYLIMVVLVLAVLYAVVFLVRSRGSMRWGSRS